MRKLVLGAALAALSLGLVPSHAAPGTGCVAGDGGQGGPPATTPGALTCTYVAGATSAVLLQLTPNAIVITEDPVGNDPEVVIYEQSSLTPPIPNTAIPTTLGATIKVTVGPDSAEVVEGAVGLVVMGDAG